MTNPADFFLAEIKGEYSSRRGPLSSATSIQRFIDGSAIYGSQEEAILSAEKSVLFTSWSFDPLLPIASRNARAVVRSWGSLLLSVAQERGVKVQILMTDKDPVFQYGEHRLVWERFRLLVNRANAFNISNSVFQVVVVRHIASWSLGPLMQPIAEAALNNFLTNLSKLDPAKQRSALLNLPGLWDKLQFDEKGVASLRSPRTPFPVFPGTQHQKLILIDEKIAYISGINHIPANLDDRGHTRFPKPWPWHDSSVCVSGPVVGDIVRCSFEYWNESSWRAKEFINQANKQLAGLNIPLRETSDLIPMTTRNPSPRGKIRCQPWRTVSRGINSENVPDTTCHDIIDGYVKAIGVAQKFIYIENQYFRDDRISDAMISRLAIVPALNVIIVLPSIPEEVIDNKGDPITMKGLALQHRIIARLQVAFGNKLGVFAPFTRTKASTMIYVHNKTMVVDDVFATTGSANADPRSFDLDTELNLAWHDPQSVSALRGDLWQEMLGAGSGFASWKPQNYAMEWSKIAKKNAATKPQRRIGYILPFKNEDIGSENPIIPKWLAQAEPASIDTLA